jgi:hypothetical protein
MNKNYIEGRYDRESWHHTAKPIGSVVEVNAAVVQGSNAFLPGEIPREEMPWEVSRGRSSGKQAGDRERSA